MCHVWWFLRDWPDRICQFVRCERQIALKSINIFHWHVDRSTFVALVNTVWSWTVDKSVDETKWRHVEAPRDVQLRRSPASSCSSGAGNSPMWWIPWGRRSCRPRLVAHLLRRWRRKRTVSCSPWSATSSGTSQSSSPGRSTNLNKLQI